MIPEYSMPAPPVLASLDEILAVGPLAGAVAVLESQRVEPETIDRLRRATNLDQAITALTDTRYGAAGSNGSAIDDVAVSLERSISGILERLETFEPRLIALIRLRFDAQIAWSVRRGRPDIHIPLAGISTEDVNEYLAGDIVRIPAHLRVMVDEVAQGLDDMFGWDVDAARMRAELRLASTLGDGVGTWVRRRIDEHNILLVFRGHLAGVDGAVTQRALVDGGTVETAVLERILVSADPFEAAPTVLTEPLLAAVIETRGPVDLARAIAAWPGSLLDAARYADISHLRVIKYLEATLTEFFAVRTLVLRATFDVDSTVLEEIGVGG